MYTSPQQAFAELTREEADERGEYLNPKPLVRLMTKEMQLWSPCGDYSDFKFTEKELEPGGISFLVPDDGHYDEYFYQQDRRATRPILVDLPNWQTLWFTTSFTRTRIGRRRFIEVAGVHWMEYLNWVRIFPDPGLPPEFQPSKWRSPIGPAATVAAMITWENLARVQEGQLWPFMTHARFLREPDNTTWTSGTYRMDKVLDAVTEICEAEDLQPVGELYLPGESEQPFPQYTILNRPTFVIDYVPRMPMDSMSGTIENGLFRTGIQIINDLIEWVTFPVLDPQDPKSIDDLTGRDGQVFPVYRSGQWTPATEISQTVHIPTATRTTAGGKSPDYINDIVVGGIDALVRFVAGVFRLDAFVPDFVKERARDTLLAFHSIENRSAAKAGGPWRLREAFSDSQSSGLSLQAWQAMKTTAFANRGYTSHSIVVANGAPYLVGHHLKVGWPVGVEMPDGTVEVDRVTEITYEDTRDAKGQIVIQVGSGEAEQEPGIRGLNRIQRMGSWLHRVALGG